MGKDKNERKAVAVDFDGVLAKYDKWKGIFDLGEPIPGAVEFVQELLLSDFEVLIYSTRTNPEINKDVFWKVGARKSHDAGDLLGRLANQIRQWLLQWGFPVNHENLKVYVGPGKPIACAYVDDRAVCCRPDPSDATSCTDTFGLVLQQIELFAGQTSEKENEFVPPVKTAPNPTEPLRSDDLENEPRNTTTR